MIESPKITRKVLMRETSAPYWTIVHLTLSGRLPLEHASMGKGDPNIYQFCVESDQFGSFDLNK